MNRSDVKFLVVAYALVFAIGWFLAPGDRLPYALGVMAVTLVLIVDMTRDVS